MITQNYLEVMENLYHEYEKSCILLQKRIDILLKEQSQYRAKSEQYNQLYNRIRRLKTCLEDTRSWQKMVQNYLLAGGMCDAKDSIFADKQE